MSPVNNQSILDAKDTYMAILELSQLLNTNLDAETLSICIQLCESGVNPDALASCIQELKKELNDIHSWGVAAKPDKDDVTNKNN